MALFVCPSLCSPLKLPARIAFSSFASPSLSCSTKGRAQRRCWLEPGTWEKTCPSARVRCESGGRRVGEYMPNDILPTKGGRVPPSNPKVCSLRYSAYVVRLPITKCKIREITAKTSNRWIRPLATWKTVKPPIQAISRTTNKIVQMLTCSPPFRIKDQDHFQLASIRQPR